MSAAMDAHGVPHRAFLRGFATDTLAISRAVFDEVSDVLHRPRLARFVDTTLREDLLDRLQFEADWFEPTIAVSDCRDPTDNKYLALALASNASTIVSSDQDLLVLSPWRGTPILRPADYLALAHP